MPDSFCGPNIAHAVHTAGAFQRVKLADSEVGNLSYHTQRLQMHGTVPQIPNMWLLISNQINSWILNNKDNKNNCFGNCEVELLIVTADYAESSHNSQACVICNLHLHFVIKSSPDCFCSLVLTPLYEGFLVKISELYNFKRIFSYSTERRAARQKCLRAQTLRRLLYYSW